MSNENYPYWYCPIFGCGYRTQYKKNIRQHLEKVHGWDDWETNLEIRKFERAHYNDLEIICQKSDYDPTKPKHKQGGV